MKYHVQFQQMGRNGRPIDHPTASDFETDDKGFGMIPSVGDYVQIIGMNADDAAFDGKVRSRLFRYFGTGQGQSQSCSVAIVVEETDDDWGALIKE